MIMTVAQLIGQFDLWIQVVILNPDTETTLWTSSVAECGDFDDEIMDWEFDGERVNIYIYME